MTGLKGAKTVIGPDGKTVTTVADSEATAREIAAAQEQTLRLREGSWWSKSNAWLDRRFQEAEETGGIFSDKAWIFASWCLFFLAAIMAWNSWFRLVPLEGLNYTLAAIGVCVLLTMKVSAARLDAADGRIMKDDLPNDHNKANFLRVILIGGLILQAVVATSLQASIATDQETGRTDAQSTIDSLRTERNTLHIAIASPPAATSEAQQKLIDAYLLKPVVNREGTIVVKKGFRVGEAIVPEGGKRCTGSSYYVTIYCPVLIEMEAARDQALQYEKDRARYDAIPDQIAALEKARPAQSSTFALFDRLAGKCDHLSGNCENQDLMRLFFPAFISFILDFLMCLVSYLAHRAERTPAPKPQGALS